MRKKALTILLMTSTIGLAGCSAGSSNDAEPVTTAATVTEASTEATSSTVTDTSEADSTKSDTPETDVPETDAPETDAPETDAPETTTSDLSGIFESEVNNPTYNASPVTFVTNGVKYTVPADYLVMYSEGIGPIAYINNVFQLKFVRKDTSFEDVLADIDALDDKAIANGAEAVVEPTKKTVGGQTFAYFVVDISGEKVMGILTESPDGKFTVGGQYAILSNTVAYEDLVNVYASIYSSASVTDEADSSEEEIKSQIKYITGEKRESSTISYKTQSITFNVPAGYYYTSETSGVSSATQFFSCASNDAFVSIDEKAFPEDTAEVSIDAMILYEENAVKTVETVDGKTIYVCTNHYEYNGNTYYELYAKCDIDDEYTYSVTADCTNTSDIPFETIREFFEFED